MTEGERVEISVYIWYWTFESFESFETDPDRLEKTGHHQSLHMFDSWICSPICHPEVHKRLA